MLKTICGKLAMTLFLSQLQKDLIPIDNPQLKNPDLNNPYGLPQHGLQHPVHGTGVFFDNNHFNYLK